MKIQGAKKVHYDSGPNMTPLVDVVMVILIFLMLAGSFEVGSQFLVSKQAIKAKGGQARPLKPGEVPDTPVEIRVDNFRDGGFIASATGMPPTNDPDVIKARLAQKRKEFLAAGTKNDQLLVKISPSRNVKYHYLLDVYQAALQAGYEKVAFATSH